MCFFEECSELQGQKKSAAWKSSEKLKPDYLLNTLAMRHIRLTSHEMRKQEIDEKNRCQRTQKMNQNKSLI